ncbi:hypothetical protein [Nocardioides pacificus]
MDITAVDERDSSWEDHRPRFRVYLHNCGETSTGGSTATYDITGADAIQVIDWAQHHAGTELTYAVALVRFDVEAEQLNSGMGRGLVWLIGRDGNDSTEDDPEGQEAQRRMLARRREPVGVPAADRARVDALHRPSV